MRNMRRKTLLLSAALLLAASHTFAQVSTEVINGLSYKINARTHTATLVGNEDNPYTGNIVVPETVTAQDGTDYSVTAFGEECFLGCIDLESVKIPSTVTTLGARILFADADHRILVPASILTGIVVMLLCDVLAKLLTFPINTITALLGIPIVIWVVIRNKSIV